MFHSGLTSTDTRAKDTFPEQLLKKKKKNLSKRMFLSLGWLLENADPKMDQTSSEVYLMAILFSFFSFSWLHFKSIVYTYVSHIKSFEG